MKKHVISLAVAAALGTGAVGAEAALVNGSTLNIGAGSLFVMEVSPGFFLPTPMVNHAGMVLGSSQATGTSHSGAPTGTEAIATSIDEPWGFFGNTGLDFTVTPTNVLSASGNTATVDMSGWRVTWNSIPTINMGGGAWNSGSWSGNVSGVAQITCGVDCSNGDTYTLQYTATVPLGDPSNFGGVHYGVSWTGTVTVPVPAAVWLLGSGLLGLVGVARRKKIRA